MKIVLLLLSALIISSCNYDDIYNHISNKSIAKKYIYEIRNSENEVIDKISASVIEKYDLFNQSITFENFNLESISEPNDIKLKLIEILRNSFNYNNSIDLSLGKDFDVSNLHKTKQSVKIPINQDSKINFINHVNGKENYHVTGSETVNDKVFKTTYEYNEKDGFLFIELNDGKNQYKVILKKSTEKEIS